MKALDTNAIVRFLVQDDERQANKVKNILLNAEKSGEAYLITDSVILETIWILTSAYKCSRENVINALNNLLILPVLKFQNHSRIVRLCKIGLKSSIDLADIYIGLTAVEEGCETTLTFDKKAAKSDLFTLL